MNEAAIEPVVWSPHRPPMNAFAERWLRTVKEECVSKFVLFGDGSLRRVLSAFEGHDHEERNHPGKENRILFPTEADRVGATAGESRRREWLGGMPRFYSRASA